MTKILLLGLWPMAAISTLLITISLFMVLPASSSGKVKGDQASQNVDLYTNYNLFTALPSSENSIEQSFTVEDARVSIVRQFLERYDSPLIPFAKHLVAVSDKYNLDFRLLPAVAMQESTLCKKIPSESYNCWGYGIYGDKVLRFASFDEAIEAVGKGLSSDYIHDGLTTPELIMERYTPSSNGSWAASVRHFMESME